MLQGKIMSHNCAKGHSLVTALIATALLCASVVAHAATAKPIKHTSFHWHVNVGGNFVTGPIVSYLRGGWSAGGGFSWRPREERWFALRADFAYDHFGISHALVAATKDSTFGPDTGSGGLTEADFDGELRAPFGKSVTGYLLAGVGAAHLSLSLVQPGGIHTYKCTQSPFGVCGRTVAATSLLSGESSTTDFSWNVGVGMDFRIDGGPVMFIEARYVHFNAFVPVTVIPVQIGLRF
jgi:opacity protein-like surface antigen